jgi:hypothetical protein
MIIVGSIIIAVYMVCIFINTYIVLDDRGRIDEVGDVQHIFFAPFHTVYMLPIFLGKKLQKLLSK